MSFTLQTLLDAGLPAVSTNGQGGSAATEFSRELSSAEWDTYLAIADPVRAGMLQGQKDTESIPDWASWSQADFLAWHAANISTDQIDPAQSVADLKAVSLAMSDQLRSMGQLLIAQRDMIAFLLQRLA
jgi:hypothetical protein